MIRIGVIGYGYWGPNLARAAAETDATQIAAIADFSAPARDRAGRRHPSARLYDDWHQILRDPAEILQNHIALRSSTFEIDQSAGRGFLMRKLIGHTFVMRDSPQRISSLKKMRRMTGDENRDDDQQAEDDERAEPPDLLMRHRCFTRS